MKISILLLSLFCLIFTNCYSYKNAEKQPNTINSNKIYELSLSNKNKIVAKNLQIINQNYFYTDKRNNEKSIPVNQVLKIEERKFSWVKSVALVAGSITAAYFLGGLAVTNSNFLK